MYQYKKYTTSIYQVDILFAIFDSNQVIVNTFVILTPLAKITKINTSRHVLSMLYTLQEGVTAKKF